MNLYDELIIILQDGKELGFTHDEIEYIIKALERAKNVEELLGLYRERLTFVFMPDCNYKDMSIKTLDFLIKQLRRK